MIRISLSPAASALVAWWAPSYEWFYLVVILAGIANVAVWTVGLAMTLLCTLILLPGLLAARARRNADGGAAEAVEPEEMHALVAEARRGVERHERRDALGQEYRYARADAQKFDVRDRAQLGEQRERLQHCSRGESGDHA